MRAVAYGICALLTAACGDVLVEACQNAGWFGATAIDANHQGVVPVLALAALLLAALAAAIARERFGRVRASEEDWLARLARELSRSAFCVHLAAIVASALVLVYATEEYEHGFGGALPFDPAHATFADAFSSLAVYIVCAILVTLGLGALMRALVATCDALARILVSFASLWDRSVGSMPLRLARNESTLCGLRFIRFSGPFGDRAPPRTTTFERSLS